VDPRETLAFTLRFDYHRHLLFIPR
jgi:hypothetical protein